MNFWEFVDKHSVGFAWTLITCMFFVVVIVDLITC